MLDDFVKTIGYHRTPRCRRQVTLLRAGPAHVHPCPPVAGGSRVGHKNDNASVKQKSQSTVRRLVKYLAPVA